MTPEENLELIKNLIIQKADSHFQDFIQEITPQIAYWFRYFKKYKLRFEDSSLYATSDFLYIDEADATFKAKDYVTLGDFQKEYTGEDIGIMTRSRQLELTHKTFGSELSNLIKQYVSDRLNEVLMETDDEILLDICPSFSKDHLFRDFYEYELDELIEAVENAVSVKVAALEFKQVVKWGKLKALKLREQEEKKEKPRFDEGLLVWPGW